MARTIDPENLDKQDVSYLRERPWMIDEYERQGFDMSSTKDGAEELPDPTEEDRITTVDMSIGRQPHTRKARPNAVVPEEPDEDEDAPYSDWKLVELQDEIEQRNADRADEDKLSKSGTKSELVERLEKDDESA